LERQKAEKQLNSLAQLLVEHVQDLCDIMLEPQLPKKSNPKL
jgi:hypothetical protein